MSRPALRGAAVVALGVLWAAHLAACFRYPLGNDPAIFQFYGWAITQGEVPYVDFMDVNTPGILLLHWAYGRLAGFSDTAFLVAVCTLSTLALAGAVRALRGHASAGARLLGAAAGLWAFVAITPWDRGQREIFQGILLLAALGTWRRPWVAGVLLGAAVTLKIAVLGVLLPVGLVALALDRRRTFVAAAFALVPIALCLLWVASAGAWQAFWEIQTTYLPLHRTQLTVPVLAALRPPLPRVLIALGLAALLAARRGGVAALWLLGTALLSAVGIYLFQGHGWTYHLHVAVPLLCPAVALSVAALGLERWAPALAVLPTVLAALTTVYDHRAGLVRAEHIDRHWDYPAHLAVAAHLQSGPATDRVLTNNDEQQLLLLARRRSATPFMYGWVASEAQTHPVLRAVATRRLVALARRPADWVVWNDHPYDPAMDSLEANPGVQAYVRAHCRLDATIGPYRVFRCGASGPPP